MAELLTVAMIFVMKSWGWVFFGQDHNSDPKWCKYENGILIAKFGDETWDRDFAAARLVTSWERVTGELSQPVVDLLKGMGWKWTMSCQDLWQWQKFNPAGTCVARQGSAPWKADVESAKLLAAEDAPEVWVPTMELRYQMDLTRRRLLQQKWLRTSGGPACGGGNSAWREVPTVDTEGRPFV